MKKTVALFLILFLVILKSGAQCFTLVYEGNGVDHMNFYFTGATVNGVNLQPGDEIGIFDGNLCVGRATLTQVLTGGVLLPGVASSDDNTTPEIDGYTAGHAITYRLCSGGTVITNVTATYSLGTGTFAVGATVQLSLAGITECTNPPLLTLAETSGSTCGINPVTVTGNTFGGSATSVTITTNGQGTLTPLSANTSPFSFSYTPATADAGQTVVIEVTTDNPEGAPCTPASSSYSLTVNPLPSTSNITGNATPACNATGIVYSVTGLAGSTYSWSVPTGANIVSDDNANSITVNFGQSNGNITVTETSAAGCVGPQRTLAITLQGCGLDADFSANPLNVCTGSQVTFTNATAGATPAAAYSWNFGSGATPASATGAGPHNVVYSTVGSKTVTLTVTEGVTSTETKTDYITVNTVPSAPSAITGTASICRPQTDVTYSVPPLAGATSYQWNYTGQGATIVGNTNTVTISFNSSATSGILTVQGVNDCGNGQWSQGYNITVNAMPSQSPVTGPAAPPCRSAGNVYSVTATAGSNYVWEVPVDADITLGQGTSSITVTFGSTDGHVSVTETNAAGCTGAPRSLYVELQGCGLNADFTAEIGRAHV